jgi:chromosome partitioning protein
MRRIITVTQRKGGVGKTTIAICAAAALARRGHDIALVDSDPHRSASQWAEPGNLEFPVYEMALEQMSVSAWAQEVRSIQAGVVVIDTAPNAREMGASIALANLILVPCTPSGLDLDATLQTLAIIDAAREHRRDQIKVILVPNRLDRRTLEGRQLIDELSEFGEIVAPPIGKSSNLRMRSNGPSERNSATSAVHRNHFSGMTGNYLESAGPSKVWITPCAPD